MCEVLLVAVIVQLEFKISEAFPTQQGTHFGGDLITEYCDKIKNLTKKKKKKIQHIYQYWTSQPRVPIEKVSNYQRKR